VPVARIIFAERFSAIACFINAAAALPAALPNASGLFFTTMFILKVYCFHALPFLLRFAITHEILKKLAHIVLHLKLFQDLMPDEHHPFGDTFPGFLLCA
jgi:uncharacterized membrane protein